MWSAAVRKIDLWKNCTRLTRLTPRGPPWYLVGFFHFQRSITAVLHNKQGSNMPTSHHAYKYAFGKDSTTWFVHAKRSPSNFSFFVINTIFAVECSSRQKSKFAKTEQDRQIPRGPREPVFRFFEGQWRRYSTTSRPGAIVLTSNDLCLRVRLRKGLYDMR